MAANYREAHNKKPGESATFRQFTKEIAATGTVSTSDAGSVSGVLPEIAFRKVGSLTTTQTLLN